MQWSRVKTILICTLLAANLFLAANTVSRFYNSYYLDTDYIKNASEVLSKRGINIGPDVIPRKKTSMPILTVRSDPNAFDGFYSQLLAAPYDTTTIGEYTILDSASGQFEISSATDFAFYTTDIVNISGSPEQYVKDFFKKAGEQEYYKITENMTAEGQTVITAEQRIGETPVYGCGVIFTFIGKSISRIEGRWVFSQDASSNTLSQTDAVNALFAIQSSPEAVTQNSGAVKKMSLVYYPSENAAYSNITMNPSYLLVFDSGSTYLFDLSTDKRRYDTPLGENSE